MSTDPFHWAERILTDPTTVANTPAGISNLGADAQLTLLTQSAATLEAGSTSGGVRASAAPVLSPQLAYHVLIDDVDTSVVTTQGSHASFLVPITEVADWDFAVYRRSDFPQHMHVTSNTRELRVRVVDSAHHALDLQGGEWLFVMRRVC